MITVNFCYKDDGYNYTIYSCASALLKHGIKLQSYHVESIEQAKQYEQECDVYLCHTEFIPNEETCQKICVALVSDFDGGWVAPHIHLLPQVRGFIESYAYKPRTLHNEPYYYYDLELLRRVGFTRKSELTNDFPIEPFPESELSKIHVHCGFGSWERMINIGNDEEVDLTEERPNPLFFAGTVEYCDTEIDSHRMAAVDMCNRVGGIGVAGRKVYWKQYRDIFLHSKAILSPWGWGEACHRDFEALAFGCILIKPDWSFVESFPDISSHEAPYIPCKLDFSDVLSIVEDITNNWEKYIPLRERGRKLAKDAIDLNLNAARLAEIIKCLKN